MANENVPDAVRSSDKVRPLIVETYAWGQVATGTKAQIVDAGICSASALPQGRKRTAYHRLDDGGFLNIRRLAKGICEVREHWPNEICQQKKQEAEKRMAMLKRLQDIPESTAGWRSSKARGLFDVAEIMIDSMRSPCGLRISSNTTRELKALAERMRMVILNANVELDETARREYIETNTPKGDAWQQVRPRPQLRLICTHKSA